MPNTHTKYKIKGNNSYTVKFPFSTEQDGLLREYFGLTPEIDLGVFLIQHLSIEIKGILGSLHRTKNPVDVTIISDVEAEEDITLPDKPI